MQTPAGVPEWARILPDLACLDVGSEIIFATDEWFAPANMLLQSHDPVWKEDEFTSQGKWMDGWESRRRRTEGHDWCIIKLGLTAKIRGFLLDTAFFTGNQVPCCSIMGTCLDSTAAKAMLKDLRTKGEIGTCATAEQVLAAEKELGLLDWFNVLPEMTLQPGYPESRLHYFESTNSQRPITHLRVNYYPDGGVARLRAFGEVMVPTSLGGAEIDLLAVGNGGVALAWSNEHYGLPRNMLLPHPAPNMGNGWETARNPNRPKILKSGDDGQIIFVGKDWAVFKLAAKAHLKRALIDTNHFKGNFPESAVIEGLDAPELADKDLIEQRHLFLESDGGVPKSLAGAWKTLMPRTKMQAHCQRSFDLSSAAGPVTHVRLTILPDGGVSRLKLFGTTMHGSARL
jgi:allantoicase